MDYLEDIFIPFRYKGKILYKSTIEHAGVTASLIKTRQQKIQRPDLVLIHGLGCSWSFWMESIRDLDEKFNVYAFDMPWNCLNSCAFDSYDRLTLWVAEIFRKSCIQNPIVVGHSYGASVMLNMALRAQTRVMGKLVLCSIFWPCKHDEEVWKLRRAKLENNYEKFIHAGILAGAGSKSDPEIIENMYEKALLKISRKNMLDYWDLQFIFERKQIPPEYVDIPVLIINGARDEVVPVSDSFLLNQKIKQAKYVCLEDSEHYPMVERKEAFYHEVLRFCS